MKEQHVVIIGGGFGGINAALALKDAPARVTLIDRRNHHLFQPLLYQVATGGLSPADIASPLRALFKQQPNTEVLLGEVTGFDAEKQQVFLGERAVDYDMLIVAAGATNHYFGNDHWRNWAPSLKSVENALDIRRRILCAFEEAERSASAEEIRALLTFVVVGGGPTGVELAGALAEIARQTMRDDFRHIDPAEAQVILVQGGPRVLPTYPEALSTRAARALEKLGVTVRTAARVTEVEREGVMLTTEAGAERVTSRTVLWAAGVKASPLGRALAEATGADVDRGGRVVVDSDLTVPGFANIFVVGDMAHHEETPGEPLPGVAQVAIQQGKYVAQVLRARRQGDETKPFQYRDKGSLATIGRNAAVADLGKLRFAGRLAWLIWLFIHLSYLVETENRLLVLLQWAWNYFTYGRSARLITEQWQAAPRRTGDGERQRPLQTSPG